MKPILLFLPALVILACGGTRYCCDCPPDTDTPRVRLVKDTPATFHVQWDAPLKEERIILVRMRRWIGSFDNPTPTVPQEAFPDDLEALSIRRLSSGLGFDQDYKFLTDELHLLWFRTGQFRSVEILIATRPITAAAEILFETFPFVEILADHKRSDIKLPSIAHNAGPDAASDGTQAQRLLAEHPFKPYELGKPSKLTFEAHR